MAKRKHSDDGYRTGDGDSSASSWMPSKKPIKSRRSRTNPTRRTKTTHSDFSDDHQTSSQCIGKNTHAVSVHLITSPIPVGASLLDWYAGVHESRGMPWRKPNDPLIGPDGRAQRAYEVRYHASALQTCSFFLRRSGYRR
jgi:A/G-specific adenine glycosylase